MDSQNFNPIEKKSVFFGHGYLGRNLTKNIKRHWQFTNDYYELVEELQKRNVSEVWHFACPQPKDHRTSLIFKNFNLTTEIVYYCKTYGAKLIYACSVGSRFLEPSDIRQKRYNVIKWLSANYIETYGQNYQILMIPRVYSADRNSGLIKDLKDKKFEGNFNQIIEFQDINDFINETKLGIETNKSIIEYEKLKRMSVNEIKDFYNL